jgi:hypothetical protein
MMEANDMLLWTKLRARVRVLLQREEFGSQIEEFNLTAAELDAAWGAFRTVVKSHL